jgi:hypothetical protein
MHWFGIGFWHRFIDFALFGFDFVLVVLPPVSFSACFISGFEFFTRMKICSRFGLQWLWFGYVALSLVC